MEKIPYNRGQLHKKGIILHQTPLITFFLTHPVNRRKESMRLENGFNCTKGISEGKTMIK